MKFSNRESATVAIPQTKTIAQLAIPLISILVLVTSVSAQTFDEKFEHWPVDLKINGRIIINHGIEDFSSTQQLLAQIAKDKEIVRANFSSDDDDSKLGLALKKVTGKTGDYGTVALPELSKALPKADVVVLNLGTEGANPEHVESIKNLKPALQQFIDAGKTLVVDAAVAGLLGAHVLSSHSGNKQPKMQAGLNLIPDCVLRFEGKGARQTIKQFHRTLTLNRRLVGVSISDGTTLMLSGRKFSCHGGGKATFTLPANQWLPLREESIAPRQRRSQNTLVDLTQWRREAIDRTLDPFPKAKPNKPFVENGTLVIVGGGGMPQGLMARFVKLAGGVKNAKLVFVPCAETETVGTRQRTVQDWKRMGVKHATFIHTKDRNQSNSDEEFLAPLKDATGIWFGGGRQWNFADSYYGTKAHKLMKDVLKRDGVIGGSSAGASIQSRYLARATPIGNFRIMAPGYERGGLGFITGVAIDQHFSQRKRHKDMTQLVDRHPQLLGIGIDEATAIVVKKSKADVVGRGKVHFYDRNLPVVSGEKDYLAIGNGSSYDLAQRKVLLNSTQKEKK